MTAAAAPAGEGRSLPEGLVDDDVREALDVVAAVDASRRRLRTRSADRRREVVALAVGGGFFATVIGWIVLQPPVGLSVGVFLACLAAATLVLSVEFEIGPGSAVPSSPVIFLSLFLLPPNLVPSVVFGGFALVALLGRIRDPERVEPPLAIASSAWHSVGPAAVFAVVRVSPASGAPRRRPPTSPSCSPRSSRCSCSMLRRRSR